MKPKGGELLVAKCVLRMFNDAISTIDYSGSHSDSLRTLTGLRTHTVVLQHGREICVFNNVTHAHSANEGNHSGSRRRKDAASRALRIRDCQRRRLNFHPCKSLTLAGIQWPSVVFLLIVQLADRNSEATPHFGHTNAEEGGLILAMQECQKWREKLTIYREGNT
ncbi:uncharacterized protein LOC132262367 [Phlebotomus argentipes]|uniref:uncharacterized protein LOC132262367 n=1 Tax=Phlebotomus argentipes TaxID=94469 RepID=UPI00289371AE|nr:uncharacterized protein LOC132262367 [Phlebotomus argentipes]